MTDTPDATRETFKQKVADCFAGRPTVRDVLSHEGFQVLVDHYPWVRNNHPQLASLDDFVILPTAGGADPHRSLLDKLLEHFLTGKHLQLSPGDRPSIAPPQPFQVQVEETGGSKKRAIALDLSRLNEDLEHVLGALLEKFQQAQVGFWNGIDQTSQFCRMRWLEHTIKAALISNMHDQGLDNDEKAALYALLAEAHEDLVVSAVSVSLKTAGGTLPVTLAGLLLSMTQGSRRLLMHCKPDGRVRSFTDLAAFASALQDELARGYRFERLSWAHTPVIGDPFAFQARQMLNAMLEDIERLRLGSLTSVSDLQNQLHRLTDPSVHFLNRACRVHDSPAVSLPAWLADAEGSDRHAYHAALLDLAAQQGQSKGSTSLSDVDDLQRYARRRLREQLQSSYPQVAQHDPDKVLIEVSQSIVGNTIQGGQSLPLRRVSLTDLAIARLRLGAGEVMTGVTVPTGAKPGGWLSIEQINALIHEVDIGGQYPRYLDTTVAKQPRRGERIRQYAREWRGHLLFSTLKASIQQQLSEPARDALLACCQGNGDGQPLRIAPLAFLCAPGAATTDIAHGMFLIKLPATHGWVLYRPFYASQALLEFAELEQLMAAIRIEGELQQSILDWLHEDVRAVYANDGFTRPHLHPRLEQLAHLLGGDSLVADELVQLLRQPVDCVFSPWLADLDTHLFDARINAMRLAASTSSMSNAQEKWQLVQQAAWSLFNTLTVFWRGPLAVLTWLVQALSATRNDISVLANGSDDARIVATVDLLTNLAMLLAHRDAPLPASGLPAAKLRFAEPVEPDGPMTAVADKPHERTWETLTAEQKAVPMRLSSWHDNQRVGNLTPPERQALVKLRATLSLDGRAPLVEGRLRGLYEIADRHYVALQGAAYEVQETWGGIQIVGPDPSSSEWQSRWQGAPDGYHIVGRERSRGPWLTRWNGEWALSLKLAGGMPRTSRSINADNQQRYAQLRDAAKRNGEALNKLRPLMERNSQRLAAYDELAAAYSRASQALPAHERANPPEALQAQKQQILAQRRLHAAELKASALFLEKQGDILQANVNTFRELSEPRFLRLDTTGNNASRFSNWFGAAIENDMLLCRRLLEQVDHELLVEQGKRMVRLPQTDEQIQSYLGYRDSVRDSLQASRRLLAVSRRLDRAIPEALENSKIDFADKATRIENAIKRRAYSTLVVRAQLIGDLAYLTLDKTKLTAEAADTLLPLREVLSNDELSRTVWSHDGLATADGSAEDKADVLEDVLRRYRAILDKAHYMRSLSDPALDEAILDEYIQEMQALVHTTEAQLATALANLDKGIATPPQRTIQHPMPARRTVIRVARGRPALVEAQGDRAVQRNPLNQQPAGNYERHGNEWHEQVAQPRAAEPDLAQLRTEARHLLAKIDEKLDFAARYADQPNSLADFLDWPIDDMSALARQLERTDDSLVDQLRQAIARVSERKQQLLTNAYLNTRHPDSAALRYLVEQQRVSIRPSIVRKALRHANDYLDTYLISDVQAPQTIWWEAHFHYRTADAKPHDFVKGHLKFREPRAVGRDAELELASDPKERIAIYRGDLRLAQIADLIPFPPGLP